jgi:flagellar motor switch protein FliM
VAQEFLSQDEVDALLKGVNGEPDAAPAAAPQDGVRPYDIARQERIVRGRMPTLDVINDRFARLMRIAMFNFMRRNPDISVGGVRVIKYGEFVRNLVVPTNLNVVQLKPLRGSALFVIEPSLVFTIIDSLFGGSGRVHTRVEGRDFTLTEQRIIQRLLSVVLEEYRNSWSPVYPLGFDYVRSEMHTQFANIATPNEIVVVTTFPIELGSGGGQLHICIPYAAIEPIRDQLASSTQGDHMGPDKRWLRMLSKQVQIAEVELKANLASIPLRVSQLLAMKVGDVIAFDPPDAVTAEVDGVPIFECRYGQVNRQYALKIKRVIAISPQDNTLGDERAA